MKRHQTGLVLLLLVVVLVLSACGGGVKTTPEANSSAEPEATESSTETEEDAVTSDEEPTATAKAPEATTPPEATATPETTATPEATKNEETLDFSDASTLEEIESINSYGVRVQIKAEGEAFAENQAELASGLTMESSFIKEPPAQHVIMSFGEGEDASLGKIEFIQVDNKSYASFGGEWVEAPGDQSPDIDELTFISPKDLDDDVNLLERVGDETLNGRETTHLRGDKETLGKFKTAEDDLGLDQAEELQLDLWIDKEEEFIVKMTLVAEGKGFNEDKPDANGHMNMTIEYFDFNEDFKIEAPKVSTP